MTGLVQITLDPADGNLRLRRLLCGKASPFRGAEEEEGCSLGRKARGFPQSGAAKPHSEVELLANLDSPGL
jgi:hypothetical protein